MVHLRDVGGVFEAPLAEVWSFFESGGAHMRAHHHRRVRRTVTDDLHGVYSWVQGYRGRPRRFTMRWTSYPPLGLVYDVLAGPFQGSRFFLFYEPRGKRTGVAVVGEFRSPTILEGHLAAAVRDFFALEFEQDAEAIRALRPRGKGPLHRTPSRGA